MYSKLPAMKKSSRKQVLLVWDHVVGAILAPPRHIHSHNRSNMVEFLHFGCLRAQCHPRPAPVRVLRLSQETGRKRSDWLETLWRSAQAWQAPEGSIAKPQGIMII